MEKVFITSAEAARVLGLTIPGVHELHRRGVLLPVLRVGPRLARLYSPEQVAALAEKRERKRKPAE